MINEVKQDAEQRMQKSREALTNALAKIRTGRANPSLLDTVKVSYYGTDTPLNQVASITVEDGRTLLISPWEKHLIVDIEKSILKSDLGLNPSTSGDVIRLPLPALTEETRKELIKQAKNEAENTRISVRNVRRDANNDLKSFLKEKEITEDEERRGQEAIQKLTDKNIEQIDSMLAEKEKDLMQI